MVFSRLHSLHPLHARRWYAELAAPLRGPLPKHRMLECESVCRADPKGFTEPAASGAHLEGATASDPRPQPVDQLRRRQLVDTLQEQPEPARVLATVGAQEVVGVCGADVRDAPKQRAHVVPSRSVELDAANYGLSLVLLATWRW